MPIDVQRAISDAVKKLMGERDRLDKQIGTLTSALEIREGRSHRPDTHNRRRRMSPKERRAVSERMTAYWAARRQKKSSKAAQSSSRRRH